MNLKEFIKGFTKTAQTYIAKFEELKNLNGEEKKARLDDILTTYCLTALDKLPLNFILKFAFKKLIIANIPHISQCIFDLIKARVEGVTK